MMNESLEETLRKSYIMSGYYLQLAEYYQNRAHDAERELVKHGVIMKVDPMPEPPLDI